MKTASINKLSFAWVFICLLFPADLHAAVIISPGLSDRLDTLAQGEEIAVIVSLHDHTGLNPALFEEITRKERRSGVVNGLRARADVSMPPIKAFLKSRGVRKVKSLWAVNAVSFSATAETIIELSSIPGVYDIRLDSVIRAPEVIISAATAPEWNITEVRAPQLWSLGYTGQGVVVAAMDTGVDPDHSALASRWRGGGNSWFDPNGQHATPFDADPVTHGTGVMGVMVGGDIVGLNSAIGMAPGARWIAVKIFDDAGNASLSGIHEGFQWLLDPDGNAATDDAPDVVNNSWALQDVACDPEFQPDILNMKAAGISVVFAGGNNGPASSTNLSPPDYPESLAVGSVDQSLNIALSSSRGPSSCDGSIYPQIAAPGMGIRTADDTLGGLFPEAVHTVDGASFAAPHVSGAVALLLSALGSCGVGVSGIETAMLQSARDLGSTGPDNDFGNGLLDVMAAYEALAAPDIAITDAVDPADDLLVSFDYVAAGTLSAPQTLVISNNGCPDLHIGAMTINGKDASTFIMDENGGTNPCGSLTPVISSGGNCTVSISFAPDTPGQMIASLAIDSDDPDTNVVNVSLSGNNNPPNPFELVRPLNGQTHLDTSVSLVWKRADDPDGDIPSYAVQLCGDPGFSGCAPIAAGGSVYGYSAVHAGMRFSTTGLLLLSFLFAMSIGVRRGKRIMRALLIITAANLLSCGGGGPAASGELSSHVSGLSSGTTYFWRITANDGRGGVTDSETWSFTTKPL